jgi:hypothetical protein
MLKPKNDEKHQKRTSAPKNMPHLPTPIFVAQKMGKSVGRCKILQRQMPNAQKQNP